MDQLAPPSIIQPARTPAKVSPAAQEALQAVWQQVAAQPYAFGMFELLRQIQAYNQHQPRLGRALRPRDEGVRVGQAPELNFAPATLHAADLTGPVPRLMQRPFGLFGPMGPLPLHLTEYVRERSHNHGDTTWARFADLFHHRAALLFFRAWAQSKPVVHRDCPWDDDFARWVSSLAGVGGRSFSDRDHIPDDAKRLHVGWLAKSARSAEGLGKVLAHHLGVRVRIQPYVGHWLTLQDEDRTRLLPTTAPRRNSALGQSAVLGRRVWDRQSHFRIHIGPLSWQQYQQFMPGHPSRLALRDWVRQYQGLALSYDVSLTLKGEQVPPLKMQRQDREVGRLGLSAWLGRRGPLPDQRAMRLRLETPYQCG